MVTALVLEWSVADGAFGVSSLLGKHASSAELIPRRRVRLVIKERVALPDAYDGS